MMEHLLNCLCSCQMTGQNRSKFLKGEGLQLMNLMLRLVQIHSVVNIWRMCFILFMFLLNDGTEQIQVPQG